MKTWQTPCVGLFALFALVPLVQAQAPPDLGGAAGAGAGAPAVPGVPAAPGAPATGAPGAPGAPSNLWSFLCPTQAQCQQCKDKFCNSQFGQLFSSALKPISAFSGGVIGSCCPNPNDVNPADLNKDATGAEGAAARIKQSEADAKARRAAIRYLATADCHRWPEAEAALINGLRADTNECVRWEAAMGLSTGCCCTKPIIEALILTVTGGNSDKNPVETSCRVKYAALCALNHCLSKCDTCLEAGEAGTPAQPERPERPERPETPESPEFPGAPASSALGGFYEHVQQVPLAQVVREARATLARYSPQQPRPRTLPPPGDQSLARLVAEAAAGRARPDQPARPAAGVAVAPAPPPPQVQPQEQPAQAASLPPSGNRDLVHLFLHSMEQDKTPAPPPPPQGINQVSYTAPQPAPATQTADYSFLPVRADNTPTVPLPACTPRE